MLIAENRGNQKKTMLKWLINIRIDTQKSFLKKCKSKQDIIFPSQIGKENENIEIT